MKLRSFMTLCAVVLISSLATPSLGYRRTSHRRSRRSSASINIQDASAKTIQVGFRYVQSAVQYRVSAKEWIDGSFEQTVSTNEKVVGIHQRQAVLQNLDPGREYLIQVQGFNSRRRPVGSKTETIARTALRCYTCNGRASNTECNARTSIKECPAGTDSCLNEVRYQNGIATFTKRCAQFIPALARKMRGNVDITASCRGVHAKDAVCQCMCKSDLCNAADLPCSDQCFPNLRQPRTATLRCTNGNRVGSVCTWGCRGANARAVGTTTSRCRTDRTWSVLTPPRCVLPQVKDSVGTTRTTPYECPTLRAPANGRLTCLSANRLNSVCAFSCRSGYTLSRGSSRRTCATTGYWSGTAAVCTAVMCPLIPPVPNLVINCDNSRNVGSTCELSCSEQLSLVGHNEITCSSTGRWNRIVPICERRGCQARPRIRSSVLMECEDFTRPEAGARCLFSCRPGYEMRGSSSSVCLNNRWSNAGPTCTKLICRPDMGQPAFGWRQCSDNSFFGSNCTFSCRAGYVLRGSRVVSCLASARWSHSAPICERVSCPPILHSTKGSYSCNNARNVGSVCSLSCNRGYGRGSSTSRRITCQAKSRAGPYDEYMGRWSPAVSECEKSRCTAFTVDPGMVRRCSKSDYREVGSVCSFSCQPGYFLAGRRSRTCRRGYFGMALGRWSAGRTYCVRRQCPRLSSVQYGSLSCSDSQFSGSNCTVTCDRGYETSGPASFQCGMNGVWNRPKPRCTRVVCRAPTEVTTRNFVFTCGESAINNPVVQRYFTDFECPLRCSSGFLIIGGNSSKCGTRGEWIISQKLLCADINECDNNNGGCDHFCSNEHGGFTCSCRENYMLNSDGQTCRRIFCPELPPDEHSTLRCTNERSIGSTCVTSCETGYEPRGGSDELICRNDGTWNELFATCMKVECPVLRAATNGNITCTEDNVYQSVCRSSCDVGFNMIGNPDTSCTAERQWTSSVPTCRRVRCPEELTSIENGIATCSDANYYNSDCRYVCNAGYDFMAFGGEDLLPFMFLLFPVSSCLSDGTWSIPATSCEKKQCSPFLNDLVAERPNSQMSCTDNDLFDSTCTIACDTGYELIGQIRSRCLSSQDWSNSLGHCQKIRCHATAELPDGHALCSDENRYNSTCSYQCNEGFDLIGAETTFCHANRSWSAPAPVCQRIECEQSRTSITNGIVTCTMENYYDSACTASCSPGYEFEGSTTLALVRKARLRSLNPNINAPSTYDTIVSHCLATGSWDVSAPSCVKHSCEPSAEDLRQFRTNGEMICTESSLFMSTCHLHCNTGYEVVRGSVSVQCGTTKEWSSNLGFCQKIRCLEFEDLTNGDTNCTEDNRFESVCSFACADGYELIGEETSTCLATRLFSNPKPTCQKIVCPTSHTNLENGEAECSDGPKFESRCEYVCNPGYEMTDVPAANPDDSPDTAVLTCQADRTWSGRLPFCNRKQCSMHDGAITRAKLNGNVQCTESSWYGSSCSVMCNVGYILDGATSTQCTASADWSPTIGHCIKVRCPALSSPQNGEMSCTNDNKYQSTCAFTCSRGYERIGASSSTCQSNRTFTQEPPMCREILCPMEYTSITDGVVICSDANRFDSMCEYNCNDGFQLTRDSVSRTRCQINYNWEALFKPVCERKLCSQGDPIIIRALQHGSIECTNDMKFESQCTLSCNVGYEITGDGSTVCLADQSWSENFGECIKVECSELADPDNGGMRCTEANKYQSVCTFSCNAGYELIGHSTSECQHDRQFSNSAPFCQKTRCPVSHLETANANTTCTEENLFESTCEYQCIPGYEVTGGVTTVTCMNDQSWSAEKAICEKKICLSTDKNIVKADKNGNLTCTDGHIFDSVCSLECDIGYELVEGGSSQTRCSEDATWQAPIGYCIKIECPMLDEPVNGNISCSENNKYLSECEFQCSLGYEIVGEAITMCQAGRTWSYAVPTCQRVSCPTNHLTLTHGSVSCSIGNKFESVCAYQCDRGYEMGRRDFNQSTCTELMLWTNQKPTCMKKKCAMDSPDIVKANLIGTVTCTEENLYQSVCSVDCPSGYELTGGHQDITCSHTAQWSESMGHCQRIRCGVLDQPINSTMVCSDEDKFESVCHFTCTPGYYRDGPSSTTCQADRTYSNELPTCQKISCPDDHNNIQFGSVNCTEGNLFQSVCSYQCDADYQIFGDSFATNSIVTSECQDFGEWTEVVPICERKTCSHDDEAFIAAMESGSVECSDGNRAGTVCMITCNEGYQVVGMTVITCTSSGSWNDSIGYCENIECPHLNPPESGDISCTSENNFASVCTYTCDDGYQFVGDVDVNEKVTQCLSNRTWTVETLTQCEKKHCPLWSAPDHGSINCTDSNLYMSQCLYMCEDGYRLSHPTDSGNQHSEIVSCGSNAEWSVAEAPQCTRITCSPNATALQQTELHGSITCSNNAFYESVCTVKCNKGYELSGENNVTSCSSSLEWTPQLSACEKIQCNALVAPANGRISCSEGSQYKSHCKLMCDLGYSILDPENDYDVNKGMECRADGSWCGEVPTCEKIQCSAAHLSIAYGTVQCSDDNIFQSTCVYHCNTGYHMIQGQPDSAECTHNTRWTNPVPTCENNRCPANDTSISEALLFGDVTCTDENKFGSRCLLKCYEGYEISGEPGTNCLESGRWSNGLGLCSKIECEPIEAPSNTSLQCTDEFKFQSLCVFECIAGYTRSDEASYDMSCQADGNWMGSVPTCEKITCPIDQVVTIEHGQVTCDDQNRFESQCVFVCDPGYTMLHHNSEYDVTTHVLSCLANGSWDFENYPECVPVGCPDVGVVNGRLDCSGGFTYGSQCMLSCDNGYEATSPSINIQCDSSGEWWPQLAACQKISCSDPTTPHTSISCTDGFNYGSICSFSSCEVGYEASTSVDDVTSCMADGQWLGPAPQCTKKTCPASFIDVNNGRVVCNDTNNFQSECEFICDTGYELNQVDNIARCGQTNTWNIAPPLCIRRQSCGSTYVPFGNVHCGSDGRCRLNCQPTSTLVGAGESICTDVNGTVSWTPALGSCLRRSCAAITSIRNGNVECTNNFKFRSVCRFICENGYQLSGPVAARCNANLQWSSETPVCQAVTCNATYIDIAFGSAIQSNSNLQGSVIRYTCTEDGYVLVGDHQITCRSDGRWSAEKPKCQRQQCPPLHIANGGVQCTREIHNEWGSQCSFFCNEFHQLDGNHSTTVCGRDGQWTNPTPFCRGHCDIDFPNFENGSVTCTNSNYHHSQCSFSCDSDENGTPLNMHGSRLLTCQSSGRWSATPPCCTDACPSRTKVDLYIVIESRSSVESGNWSTLLHFINLLIRQFSVNDETTLVGLLRYHREVDVIGEVPLGRHRNLESLSRAIKFMPYGGYGANIGRALQHVSSRSLESAGNRLDVRDHVILFTDGRSQDNVTTAAQLLKKHATVQVVGMQSNRMIRKQLETIASKPNYVHSVPNISALDQSVVEAITMNMCENPCLLSQNYITRMRSYITV